MSNQIAVVLFLSFVALCIYVANSFAFKPVILIAAMSIHILFVAMGLASVINLDKKGN